MSVMLLMMEISCGYVRKCAAMRSEAGMGAKAASSSPDFGRTQEVCFGGGYAGRCALVYMLAHPR